ncbi:MAG: CoA pyrophosphatase [Brachybacterium sp.]|nr:CoA pyrophosphatase [Brachybacterium sp.]
MSATELRAGMPDGPPVDLPAFLAPLAERARRGTDVLAEPLVAVPEQWEPRRSAVLLLIVGTRLDNAQLVLEERSHRMRSQPGQYALPGGRIEEEDPDDIAGALREAAEETGLRPADVAVLGAFAPIPMPWRSYSVRPVLAWAPHPPALDAIDPAEVASITWAPLLGTGSLTDPRVRGLGVYGGHEVGICFDLPEDAFVWGFTAMIVDAVLEALAPQLLTASRTELPRRAVPDSRGRPGL